MYHLRGSEVELLERAGRYRAVFMDDLQADAKDVTRASTDVASLERQGLIETRTATRLRDGAVADVVSVTHAGKALLDHHRDQARDLGQVYHAGWVKPAEVWHDVSLFRMVRQAEHDVVGEGEHLRRVVLDDELKARAYQASMRLAPMDTRLRMPTVLSPRHSTYMSRTGSSSFRMFGWRSPTGRVSCGRKTWSW